MLVDKNDEETIIIINHDQKQFKMDATQFFKSAQRRKANEGVRIANLDPATRMNSCNEFRQGTNIMMRAVRGVGD